MSFFTIEPNSTDRQDDEQPHAGDDADVCNIKNCWKSEDMNEVNDVSDSKTRLTQQPVGQVPEVSAEEQPEENAPGERLNSVREKDDEASDSSRDYCEDPRGAAEHGERRPRISHEGELEQLTDDRNRLANGQVRDDKILSNLIGSKRQDSDEDEYDQDPETDRASRRLRRSLSLRQQSRGS